MIWFVIISFLVLALYLYKKNSSPSIKINQRTLDELRKLPKGMHHFDFQISRPQNDIIERICQCIIEDFQVKNSQIEFKISDMEPVSLFKPKTDSAIYIYAENHGRDSVYDQEGNTKRGLIGFVNFEFYEWINHMEFVNQQSFSLYNLEFDPFDKRLHFSIMVN